MSRFPVALEEILSQARQTQKAVVVALLAQGVTVGLAAQEMVLPMWSRLVAVADLEPHRHWLEPLAETDQAAAE